MSRSKAKLTQWTTKEINFLKKNLSVLSVEEIARKLNRPYLGVVYKVASLRPSVPAKDIKIPRGKGLDKKSLTRLRNSLESWEGTFRGFCQKNGVPAVYASVALAKFDPDFWQAYADGAGLVEVVCRGCHGKFYWPEGQDRDTCSPRCRSRKKRDEDYFDGARKTAVGLLDGVCQLCLEPKTKGLSAHHLIGKGNDPDNLLMVALCVGCHQLVTQLSLRKFLASEDAWERLIRLVFIRQNVRLEGFSELASCKSEVSVTPLSLEEFCAHEGVDPKDLPIKS